VQASGRNFRTRRLAWRDEPLREIVLPRGRLCVTRGIGSGLTHRRGEAPNVLWAIGDRGPNLKVGDAIQRFGLETLRPLLGRDGAKIMPCLEQGPAIVELRVDGDQVTLVRSCPWRGSEGRPVSGLPPPAGSHAECEPAFSLTGAALGSDPSGVDSEGIAALAGGGFWIADEYGPSLLKVDNEGVVTIRWVPIGMERMFEGAAYPIAAVLPAIASARRLNRGFEALALSPDERIPEPARASRSRNARARPQRAYLAARRLVRQYHRRIHLSSRPAAGI
jgi:hypothetical protein